LYSNILVPVDLAHGEVVARIVAVARHLAGADGAITLLTVIEPVPTYVAVEIPAGILEANRAAARGRLDALAAGEGLGARVVLRQGAPAAEDPRRGGEHGGGRDHSRLAPPRLPRLPARLDRGAGGPARRLHRRGGTLLARGLESWIAAIS
jgi:hypothetical protein